MTFEELLHAIGKCKQIDLNVRVDARLKNATSVFGRITTIKSTANYKGCAVRFPGHDWDTWFHAEKKDDKRSHYMDELKFAD